MSSRSQRMEDLESTVANLENRFKNAFEEINVLKEEIDLLKGEKRKLSQRLIEVQEELDLQSTKIKDLELNYGVVKHQDDSSNNGSHQKGDDRSSSHTEKVRDSDVRVTTQTDLLAEAIRISTLPCPTLETNDKPSIKRFIQKMEEYKMLGGKRRMASLMKARIVETLVDKFNIDSEAFLDFSDEEAEQILFAQFHSKNGFSWNEEIRKVKLKKSKDYNFGFLRDYVEDFRFVMRCAGEEHAPHMKSIIKTFLRGLDDDRLSLEIERENPMTLEKAFKYAEQVRSTLSEYHSLSKAFENPSGYYKVENNNNENFQSKKGAISKHTAEFGKHASLPKKETKWCSYHKNNSHNTEDCYSLKNMSKDNKDKGQTEANLGDTHVQQAKPKFTPNWGRKASAKRIEINSINSLYESNSGLHYEVVEISDDMDYSWRNGFQIRALLDSGCSENLINEAVYNRLKDNGVKEGLLNVSLNYAKKGSEENKKLPLVNVQIKLNLQGVSITVKTTFLVVNDLNEECILGLPLLKEHGLLSYIENPVSWLRLSVPISPEEESENEIPSSHFEGISQTIIEEAKIDISKDFSLKSELMDIVNTYEYLFRPLTSQDHLKVPPMEITLREGAKLNARSPRKVSDSIRKLIRDECHRLLELGFITESLSEVTCPVVPVIQKGKFRLCNDYRELNTFTVPIRFPIPLIENSLRKFQTLPWKIQLDMIKSFNQIILHESSRYLSAFITLDGVYEWNRVPFGLRNSPSYLNYVMKDIIFKDMDDIVECFFDDILIGAETEVLLLEKFNLVMNRAKMFNLHFNMDKCKFGYTVVSYLGHMLTADGIYMSQDRKLAIQNIPSPKSKKELQRFLGITNYFHKFIKGYATLAAPLSAMTGTTKIFEWNAKEEESFQTLKQQISLSDHLYFIDYNLPIVLRVDASQYGVGGVLLNVKNGEERCIEFISHTFSEAAR